MVCRQSRRDDPTSPLPSFDSLTVIRPSLRDLSAFSPEAFAFAFVFDFLTILLTLWLEAIPYGELDPEQARDVIDAILEHKEWNVNRANQLEYGLSRPAPEAGQHTT